MIVRILGAGQHGIAETHLDELNQLDTRLQNAVGAANEQAFAAASRVLPATVHRLGTPLPAETPAPSVPVLPEHDTGLGRMHALLANASLIMR
ncbi:PspA-associated protein PspAA [Streptantibioticus ferralitis]|uniref:PspA-associated domain-containing protein n=1 Tax=Streptantibioticus ferralitis TaxID=236510 RepID=A0ABT5YWZ3_9ACTN|nr:hypothetical protein [Streptantibioticus ferralitis]MDF2255988.1 hypothetical protein [Streptantibioticus ferralitis]